MPLLGGQAVCLYVGFVISKVVEVVGRTFCCRVLRMLLPCTELCIELIVFSLYLSWELFNIIGAPCPCDFPAIWWCIAFHLLMLSGPFNKHSVPWLSSSLIPIGVSSIEPELRESPCLNACRLCSTGVRWGVGESPKHVGVGVRVAGSDTGARVIIVHDVEVCLHSLNCLLFLALFAN